MNISELINSAGRGNNDSENILFEMMRRDYQNFLLECMQLFLSDKIDKALRLTAASVLSTAIKESNVRSFESEWTSSVAHAPKKLRQ